MGKSKIKEGPPSVQKLRKIGITGDCHFRTQVDSSKFTCHLCKSAHDTAQEQQRLFFMKVPLLVEDVMASCWEEFWVYRIQDFSL
jgi:hypothetical protein